LSLAQSVKGRCRGSYQGWQNAESSQN